MFRFIRCLIAEYRFRKECSGAGKIVDRNGNEVTLFQAAIALWKWGCDFEI